MVENRIDVHTSSILQNDLPMTNARVRCIYPADPSNAPTYIHITIDLRMIAYPEGWNLHTLPSATTHLYDNHTYNTSTTPLLRYHLSMTSFLHPMAFDRNDVMILRNEGTLEPQAAHAQLQTKFLKHLGERTLPANNRTANKNDFEWEGSTSLRSQQTGLRSLMGRTRLVTAV